MTSFSLSVGLFLTLAGRLIIFSLLCYLRKYIPYRELKPASLVNNLTFISDFLTLSQGSAPKVSIVYLFGHIISLSIKNRYKIAVFNVGVRHSVLHDNNN
jgi:hypothetical protein